MLAVINRIQWCVAVCAVNYTANRHSVVDRTPAVIDPIVRYPSRIAICAYPLCIRRPRQGGPGRNTAMTYRCGKTRMVLKKFKNTFTRFDRIHEGDGRRDGRTDTARRQAALTHSIVRQQWSRRYRRLRPRSRLHLTWLSLTDTAGTYNCDYIYNLICYVLREDCTCRRALSTTERNKLTSSLGCDDSRPILHLKLKVTFDLRSQVTFRPPQVAVKCHGQNCVDQFVTPCCRQCPSARSLLSENMANEFIRPNNNNNNNNHRLVTYSKEPTSYIGLQIEM